jgi:CDP-diacylglycerol--glycerol-3-phosphate 3-phosphatidyltransferase
MQRGLVFTSMTPSRTLGTLPNILSCSRLALAAGFVASSTREAQVGIIGIAAITDFLDGWLARRVHATSRWGAMLDPIADRFFVLTVVASMLFTGALSTGAYFILITRDLATAVGFVVARIIPWLRTVPFQARISGKVVTVLQMITLAALLVLPMLAPLLLALVGVASVLSIVDYTLALWRARAR